MRGLFVTGTDTEVGKTVVAATVAATLTAGGLDVAAFKPVVTGLDEPADPDWPRDHELLSLATGGRVAPEIVAPFRFGPAVSPHLAAALAGETLTRDGILEASRIAAADAEVIVVEGVGGLLVPLTPDYLVRNLAGDMRLPLVIAARPGLGTINHTLLAIEAAWTAELEVAAVVLTPWLDEPSEMQASNRDTIDALGGVEVFTLPPIARGEPELLAAAGASLPIERWLDGGD